MLPLHSTISPNPHSIQPTPRTVREVLIEKHPSGQPAYPEILLTPPEQEPHPVLFDQLDGEAICTAALRIEGAAGPSGVDANGWRRLCISFKSASSELCNSLALLARQIRTYVDPQGLAPLLASHLIALDKCLGVRPIGVGETVRCIISQAILSIIGPDIQEAAGAIQLCAGHEAGCEAAVHAMRKIFLKDETEAILQIDATNAFNSLNRQATLITSVDYALPSPQF